MSAVGFIGLGNMGGPMAGNLVKAGHKVKGCDLIDANVATAQALGVETAASIADAVAAVDVVFTMLPAGKHLLDVYKEALPAAQGGTLFIDCSTVDVASAKLAHEQAAAAGMLSLDSPVSGGVTGAEAGTLTLMAGGSKAAYDAAQNILDPVSQKVVHCGDGGAGQAAKICNNMLLAISMIGVSEAFVLAEKLGLSKEAMFDVASTSSGQCWSLTTYCPVPDLVPTSPANNDYKPGFSVDLMVKDTALSQEAASSFGAHTELGKHATEIYKRMADDGMGGDDFSAVVNFVRKHSE